MGKALAFAVGVCLFTAGSAAADVQVSLNSGRVSITAKDATVRQILAEWARVGQTKVVNAERIPGGPMTLELTNVPEGQALDVLLRAVSGYMAAPRQTAAPNLSVFDRIIVMPTSAAPRPAASAQPAPIQQPQFATQPPPPEDDQDEPPAPNVQVQNPRGPVFSFPPPQVGAPAGAQGGVPVVQQPGPTYGAAPTGPVGGGTATPGQMTAPQQWQPGMPTTIPQSTPSTQPGQPTQQPGQISRPGGRGGAPGRQ